MLEVYFPCSRAPCGVFCDSQTFPAPATENNPQENRRTCCTSMLYSNSTPLAPKADVSAPPQTQTAHVTCAHCSCGSPGIPGQQQQSGRFGAWPASTPSFFFHLHKHRHTIISDIKLSFRVFALKRHVLSFL